MSWLIKIAAPLIVPLLVAPLTVLLGKLILNARHEIDKLPSYVKQGVIVLIATALTGAASFLGVELCPPAIECTLENFDQQALVAALLSFALHSGLKKA
jgi:hypothetical protein